MHWKYVQKIGWLCHSDPINLKLNLILHPSESERCRFQVQFQIQELKKKSLGPLLRSALLLPFEGWSRAVRGRRANGNGSVAPKFAPRSRKTFSSPRAGVV